MNLLDEQMRADQRALLSRWGIPFRQIGREIAPAGIQDADIIPWLQSLNRPTFFTHDQGFFNRVRVHPGYGLVWLNVSDVLAAEYIRRTLRHPRFDTKAKRMGVVARAHPDGIQFWVRGEGRLKNLSWLR